MRVVVYSAGPPLPGGIEFGYERPRLVGEYPVSRGPLDFRPAKPPSLTVFWSNFVTATRYDTWIRWGQNLTTPEVVGLLNTSQYEFEQFPVMLGVEYQVYIRAFNYWGQSTTVVRTFLHPKFDVIADGSHSMMALPHMLSPTEKQVSVNVLIPRESFLSLNSQKVLTFRAANRSAGDQDPCRENSRILRCTHLNFHMEVPATRFVVFRRPIRLQFIFGQEGWQDPYFRPKLRYWETHDDLWKDVASTCPQEQVHDRWNKLHRIYEISVCHLTQFAIFEVFEPAAPTEPPPVPPRPKSYGGATFFIVLGGCVIGGALVCCICYFGCVRRRRGAVAYKDMGIKSVNDRLPSRRLGSSGFQVLALPEGDAPAPEPGGFPALPAPNVPEADQDDGPRALPPVQASDAQLLALPPPGPAEGVPLSSEPQSIPPLQPPLEPYDGEQPPGVEPQGAFFTQEMEDVTGPEAELEPLGAGTGGFGVVPTGSGPRIETLPHSPDGIAARA